MRTYASNAAAGAPGGGFVRCTRKFGLSIVVVAGLHGAAASSSAGVAKTLVWAYPTSHALTEVPWTVPPSK